MGRIYLIQNILNGKVYIGFTTQTLAKRFNDHIVAAKRNSKNSIHKAIRKYGIENFVISLLQESKNKNYALNVLEPKYIEEYDSYNSGYNMTTGGDGGPGYKHSEETKKLIAKFSSGRKNPHNKIWNSNISKGKSHRKWQITDPKGKSFIINNLARFCRENDLKPSNMYKVYNNIITQHKGYKVKEIK